MPAHEFLFALDLSDQAPFDEMLREVATNLLGHIGYACDAIAELVALMHAARTQGRAHGPHHCRVQFSAHAGDLQIVISYTGGSEWHTTRPLP